MATYEYVDTTGALQKVEANDPNSAIANATNKATTSGVSLYTQPTTTTTTPTPTAPDTALGNEPTVEDVLGSYQAPTPTGANTPYQDIDEDKVRRDVIKQYQGQINATKSAYSTLLGETKLTGQGRLGETGAQQARAGLLGSDFGQAQTDKTRQLNQSQEEKVLESQATAIANIMAQANKDADSRVASKRAAKQYGYESYKTYQAEEKTRKQENLQKLSLSLLRQSIDPKTLGAQLKDLAKSYGVTEADIINSYLGLKSEQDAIEAERQAQLIKDNSFNLSEGQSRYQYNPETGQVEEVASKGKTYAPKTGSTSGAVYNGKVLTSSQKTAVDNLDAVATSLNSYKQLYNNLVGNSGINLTGSDAGQLAGAYNALIFQIAQAAGTGALQAADREVVEAMIPNPTTLTGGFGSAVKGGKEGGKKAIDEAALIFANKRNAILGETPTTGGETKTVKQRAEQAGYDYEAMRADGLSDAEIANSL